MLEVDNSITFNGKTFRTSLRKEISDDEYDAILKQLKSVPSEEEMLKNIGRLDRGATNMSEVTSYFFKDLMYNVRNGQDAWSINEAFQCKEVAEYFAAKVAVNSKVFPEKYGLAKNVESALRLCGIRCCRKPAQFPLKTVKEILDEFLPDGGNWYDPCMGWGARMTGAWQHKNVTYFGTDTNEELYNRLLKLAMTLDNSHFFKFSISNISATDINLDWAGRMDLCFTSPPYYNAEYYEGEKTSCTEETTYEQWKDEFLRPVFKNCYIYLKEGGVMAWNIKDIYTNKTWWPLVNDSIKAAEEAGLRYEGDRTLKNIKRMYGSRGDSGKKGINPNADERILIFRK